MNLVELISADGFSFTKVAATHGGEWHGPCPFCGGNDRFRINPYYRENGYYACRRCNKSGDAIQYLIDAHDLTFQEACETAGITPRRYSLPSPRPQFTPREMPPPPELWQKRAGEFINEAQKNLWRSENAIRAFLKARGLIDETIHLAGLGWNEKDNYYYRENWGLPIELKPNGKIKRLWLAAGIVIPAFDEGRPIRLRVRRFDPSGPRYVLTPGSCVTPFLLPCKTETGGEHATVIVESELDGWLVWQEAGDLCSILALGSVKTRPNEKVHNNLLKVRLILNALDYDSAGRDQSWNFWPKTYGNKIKRWPVPIGKDPGEAAREGLNIRAWIEVGLSD